MSTTIDINTVVFIVIIILNVVLCLKRVPILGMVFGLFTVILTGAVFISNQNINIFFSYFTIMLGISTLIINGKDALKK